MLVELERKLETVAGRIVSSQPEAVRSCIRDTRRFIEVRQRVLCKLLNSEPRIARAAIGKHVQKITLTPEGRAFIASGSWDLLGEGSVAVTMVPEDRIAPGVYINLVHRCRLKASSKNCNLKRLKMGSIPIARSITHDDSIVLTPLNQLNTATKLGVLVP